MSAGKVITSPGLQGPRQDLFLEWRRDSSDRIGRPANAARLVGDEAALPPGPIPPIPRYPALVALSSHNPDRLSTAGSAAHAWDAGGLFLGRKAFGKGCAAPRRAVNRRRGLPETGTENAFLTGSQTVRRGTAARCGARPACAPSHSGAGVARRRPRAGGRGKLRRPPDPLRTLRTRRSSRTRARAARCASRPRRTLAVCPHKSA